MSAYTPIPPWDSDDLPGEVEEQILVYWASEESR